MLRTLDIRDVLIIDRLTLDLGPGLNVLTGETGAGKSILLDALGFVLGWRGRADLVRRGARQGEVSAVFELAPGHRAFAILREAGIETHNGEELILRRINSVDGRKTAYVNDRRVSGEVLRQLSDVLVELHGQNDDRGLLNPRGHRALLDDYAGLDLAPCRAAWAQLRRAAQRLSEEEAALDAMRTQEEFLRHAVAELDKLRPEAGEDAALDARRRLMQGAAKIHGDVARALAMIEEGGGAEQMLRDVARHLEGAAAEAKGMLDAPLGALSRAMIELSDAHVGISACLAQLDADPHTLENVEERLFALRALARKHNVLPDALGEHAAMLRAKLEQITQGDGNIAALKAQVAQAQTHYSAHTAALSQARRAAAQRLDAAIAQELAPLKMERAVFTTRVTDGSAGPEGLDEVTFTVATNPGAPSGPLSRIASGGELSRFLLALKVCLSARSEGLTMIFDEIDRGVGGATADAVGRRLKELSARAQILVVTHSPQVAALGTAHWQVEKRIVDEQTLSNVVLLSPEARIEEVARMLSGDTVTDTARAAAKSLLELTP